jgi:hypothetical protein
VDVGSRRPVRGVDVHFGHSSEGTDGG